MSPLFRALVVIACLPAAGPVQAAPPATAPADGRRVERWVGMLANVSSDWTDREEAETELAAVPAETALPVLVGRLESRPPGPVHPPAESSAADKDGPPEWLAYYALCRATSVQIGKHGPDAGRLLADLLAGAAGSEARRVLAEALRTDWADRAEAPLARVFRDGAETEHVRAAAASALLAHRRDRYYDEARAVALSAADPLKNALFPLLAWARPPAGRGVDPVVVVIGFEILQQQHRSSRNPAAGYGIAVELEAYLHDSFRPDPSDAKYRPDGEAGNAFRRDTIDYALKWWQANSPVLQLEVAKFRPAPA